MKKILTLSLAAFLTLSLNSFAQTGASADGGGSRPAPQGTQLQTGAQAPEKERAVMIPGTLYHVNLKDGETPRLKGLKLTGNRVGRGSGDAEGTVNSRGFSNDNIRSVFELNEWIGFLPDRDDSPASFKVFVDKHSDDRSVSDKLSFAALTDSSLASAELAKNDEDEWGSLYVNPDDAKPGYFDLIFTEGNKITACMTIRLYAECQLDGKSDPELESLMSNEITAAKAKAKQ